MFKYKIGQHVWFLLGPMAEDEDPEYLEGFITRQYVDDDHHGSPDALYEIQAAGDLYDREEYDLYASFDELNKAVTEDLQYWVDHAKQLIKKLKEELHEARSEAVVAKKRLARWVERSQERVLT